VKSDFFSTPAPLIHRASRLLARKGDARMKALGLAMAQVPVLTALKEDGAGLTQKELAAFAQIEQPTMAQLLARMERDGLVRRLPDPADKRSSLIMLTSKASARLQDARAVLFRGGNEALSGLTEREIATLTRLLKHVVRNLVQTGESLD
jgi:MarR family transcriptional regulator, transcriptional regulator for hemolysin